jgi:excisionase family DNA binding protein
MKLKFTTRQAAEKLGIHRVTLQEWVRKGWIVAPATQNIGGGEFRLWSKRDIDKARKAIAKRKA